MMIEYTLQNFDRKVVESGCIGLGFKFEGLSQYYKA